MHDLIIEEELPNYDRMPNADILPLLADDLRYRRDFGLEKYGTLLQDDNGRDALLDAYHEGLDLMVYLKQATRNPAYEEDRGQLRFLLSHAIANSMCLRKMIQGKHPNQTVQSD